MVRSLRAKPVFIAFIACFMLLAPSVPFLTASAQDAGKILRVHQTTDPDVVDPQQ
jgi:ABC-type oligopeptide transport system substrate-binding subunit